MSPKRISSSGAGVFVQKLRDIGPGPPSIKIHNEVTAIRKESVRAEKGKQAHLPLHIDGIDVNAHPSAVSLPDIPRISEIAYGSDPCAEPGRPVKEGVPSGFLLHLFVDEVDPGDIRCQAL